MQPDVLLEREQALREELIHLFVLTRGATSSQVFGCGKHSEADKSQMDVLSGNITLTLLSHTHDEW
jgi:hypothetical protein